MSAPAAIILLTRNRRQKPQESPPEQQPRQADVPQRLRDYVTDCRSKGFSDDAIRKRLLEAGHRVEVVDAVMAAK